MYRQVFSTYPVDTPDVLVSDTLPGVTGMSVVTLQDNTTVLFNVYLLSWSSDQAKQRSLPYLCSLSLMFVVVLKYKMRAV